jgi:hypothetical protein
MGRVQVAEARSLPRQYTSSATPTLAEALAILEQHYVDQQPAFPTNISDFLICCHCGYPAAGWGSRTFSPDFSEYRNAPTLYPQKTAFSTFLSDIQMNVPRGTSLFHALGKAKDLRRRVDWEKASRWFWMSLSVCAAASELKIFRAILQLLSRESEAQVYAELS